MATQAPEKRWKAAELAEHWGVPVNRDFWRIIDDQDVPFLYVGQGQPAKGRPGQRGKYRFRPEAILAWEKEHERSFGRAEPAGVAASPAPTIAKLHDGKPRGGRKGGAGRRARA